jgi:protein-disulfide isomerase
METPQINTEQKNNQSMMVPVAIVVAGLLIAGALVFNNLGSKNPTNIATTDQVTTEVDIAPITEKDHILGNPKATLLVVEYSDMECPFCKEFHKTLHQMMTEFGSEGKVAWVYRHFPIYKGTETSPPLHSKAGKEAEATECAAELGGNDIFWKYINRIYEITPSNNGLDLNLLPQIATEVGLDKKAFETCLSSNKYATKIEQDYYNALKAGARGTPYTVIVDTRTNQTIPIEAGAIPYTALATLLRSILAR